MSRLSDGSQYTEIGRCDDSASVSIVHPVNNHSSGGEIFVKYSVSTGGIFSEFLSPDKNNFGRNKNTETEQDRPMRKAASLKEQTSSYRNNSISPKFHLTAAAGSTSERGTDSARDQNVRYDIHVSPSKCLLVSHSLPCSVPQTSSRCEALSWEFSPDPRDIIGKIEPRPHKSSNQYNQTEICESESGHSDTAGCSPRTKEALCDHRLTGPSKDDISVREPKPELRLQPDVDLDTSTSFILRRNEMINDTKSSRYPREVQPHTDAESITSLNSRAPGICNLSFLGAWNETANSLSARVNDLIFRWMMIAMFILYIGVAIFSIILLIMIPFGFAVSASAESKLPRPEFLIRKEHF